MHDDHKGAEVRVASPIGGARIRNGDVAVVEIGHGRAARFVRPVTVTSLSVPVEVNVRPDDERSEVPLLWTFIVSGTFHQSGS